MSKIKIYRKFKSAGRAVEQAHDRLRQGERIC